MTYPDVLVPKCSNKDCKKDNCPSTGLRLGFLDQWRKIKGKMDQWSWLKSHILENHVVPRVSWFLHGRNFKTEIVLCYGRNRVNRVLMSDVRSQRSLLLITRCSEINNFRFLTCSPIVPTLLLLHVTFNPKPSGAFKINCSIFIQNCSKVWLLEWNHVILWNSEWQSEIRDMSTFRKLRA